MATARCLSQRELAPRQRSLRSEEAPSNRERDDELDVHSLIPHDPPFC